MPGDHSLTFPLSGFEEDCASAALGWSSVPCNLVAQSAGTAQGGVKREVERYLTGQETGPWEMLYFKMYQSQLAVIEQALGTASLMLGSPEPLLPQSSLRS